MLKAQFVERVIKEA